MDLMSGSVILAVVLELLAAAYLLIPTFVEAGAVSSRGPLMKLTHKFAEMTPEKRPQDPHMDGTALRFEILDHRGECPNTMPQTIN